MKLMKTTLKDLNCTVFRSTGETVIKSKTEAVPSRYFCGGSFCFMSWCLKYFVLLAPYVCFHIFS